MSKTFPEASLLDSLGFNLAYVLPIALQGTFTRRRPWVGFWSRVLRDPSAVRRVQRLRRKYGSDDFYLRLGTTRTLLVLDREGIRRVLDRSPDVYGPPGPKREGMNHFQPGAVTVSEGEDWRLRRRFNEAVLDSGRSPHGDADAFLEIIRGEIAPGPGAIGPPLVWEDFDRLFERITLQVIFGPDARDDRALTGRLRALMLESNRSRSRKRKSRHFDPFYEHLGRRLRSAGPGSLAARCARDLDDERLRVENQVPHWMFAMWETLGANTLRALALIASRPAVEERVRREMAGADLASPVGIDGLGYLGGCVQEAMRLWPTTPMLLRETRQGDVLGGVEVPAGTQVLILNGANHRDAERCPFANEFRPEDWAGGDPDPLFNHLSNGPQDCAGRDLALFLAKGVLATLLDRFRYTLKEPRLDPARPLPDALDYFRIRFEARPSGP